MDKPRRNVLNKDITSFSFIKKPKGGVRVEEKRIIQQTDGGINGSADDRDYAAGKCLCIRN